MKKRFGVLICATAALLAVAPTQAQAGEERRAEMSEQRKAMYEQMLASEAYGERQEVFTSEAYGEGYETYAAGVNLNVRPEGELNAEDITVGGVYYDEAAKKLMYAVEYKLPTGVSGNVGVSLYEGDVRNYNSQSRYGNGYYTSVFSKKNVTEMPTEAVKFTVGVTSRGEWVAYKTVEIMPIEWNWNGSMETIVVHENMSSTYMNVYVPAEAGATEFALFCGDQKVGMPRYAGQSTSSYLYADFGLHNEVYVSGKSGVKRLYGTMYFAEKLDADKEYTIKVRIGNDWVAVGKLDVRDEIYVTGASPVAVQEGKPVVRVAYQGTISPNFTVELVSQDGEVVASAAGAPDVYTSTSSGLWYINTNLSAKALSDTTICVKDENGVVLGSNSFYYSTQVYNFYYDYSKDQLVLLTQALPDGTAIEVLAEDYVGTATVAGDKAVVTFTKDGVPCVLEKGNYYNFECYYTFGGNNQNFNYLYGEIHSFGEAETPDDYNNIYNGNQAMAGATELEFSIRVYKNTWEKYVGDVSLEVVDPYGAKVGTVEIVNGPELREWWLGNDEHTTPFYEYKVKWTGEALQEGNYTVKLFRGSKQVTEFWGRLQVLNPDNAYGYFYLSNSTDIMRITYRGDNSSEEIDFSLVEFVFTDFGGNVVELPVSLRSTNKYNAEFVVYKADIPENCLGLTCTAFYDGKPVYNTSNANEPYSRQISFPVISYSGAYTQNDLYSFYDAAYGLGAENDVTVTVREVGSMKPVATWNVKGGMINFDETMLAGLAHNDFSKPYSVDIKSADGYAGYYERLYLYIDGEEIIGGGTDEPDDPNGGGTVVDPETDPIDAFVTRMYQVILEREPDAGSSTWIDGLKDGSMTGVRVADGFVLSEEMLNKDISNEEFVKILYRAFFGREADEGGLATWKGLLDNGCKKTYVFAGFANSAEFGALCTEAGIVQGRAAEYLADRQTGLSEQDYKVWCFVERMYTEVLKRTADESGVRTWVGVLQDGSYTGVRVADGFLMSEEFLAKDMTNEEYVRIMYRAFFGRDADAEGLATWTNALATGWTKQRVFAGFANSNEFGVLCEQAGIVKGTAAE